VAADALAPAPTLVARGSDLEADVRALEAELRRLEAEYNMYFAGQLPRPPWETRTRVEQLMKRLERSAVTEGTAVDRFRQQTLQSRLAAFVDLWDRGLRAREEGRPGPFARRRSAETDVEKRPADRIVYVTVFADPARELDRLHDLYERLTEVRHELGAAQVPFHRFARLVRERVASLKRKGVPEVAFRVAVHGGKVTLVARGRKGASSD
jgi:hypothetical protein